MRGLVGGTAPATAESRARRMLDQLPARCLVTVMTDPSGVRLPAVGAQCAAATPGQAAAVDPAALRDCLATLLGVWVDRWGPDPQPLQPNIIFILSDDQRWDTTDTSHSPTATPIMAGTRAELADHGVEFTRAFMTTPLCCPSRSSILRGQYAHRTGVYKNGGNNGGADDFDDSSTVATWLQAAGYTTSLMGKYLNGYNGLWANGSPPYVPPGWSEWRGMKNVAYFNYTIVEPDGMGGYVEKPSYNEADVSDKPTWVQNTALMDAAAMADLDQIRIDQLEMLQAVDEAIGGSTTYGITGIMQHLRNLGVANDTLVIYFSDNGWYWGEHRFRAKNKPYEEAIRSPMFVYYPKLAPLPRGDTHFALNIDIAPTLAELAGAGVPIFEDGESLLHVIDGTQPANTWRTDFLTEGWPGGHPWATVREAQWKDTETPDTPGDVNTTFQVELYDLISDPYELTNVASAPENATRVADMAVRLRQLRQFWPVDSDPNGPDPAEDE